MSVWICNLDKISWECLSENINAISILENNLDKENWDYLSGNINAISILEKNMDKLNWNCLSTGRWGCVFDWFCICLELHVVKNDLNCHNLMDDYSGVQSNRGV